jgi:hypothetical protein
MPVTQHESSGYSTDAGAAQHRWPAQQPADAMIEFRGFW